MALNITGKVGWWSGSVGVAPAYDADAQAFITAASITNSTQQTAINQLVLDLKSANIWTKMKAVYPFVGGTASSHMYNLKDARDLNAAYRINFLGGGAHDANGYTGNGTTAYAKTWLPINTMGQNSIHISWRSNTNVGGAVKAEIGQDDITQSVTGYSLNGAGTGWVTRLNSNANSTAVSTTTSNGFYQMSRLASSNYVMQKDATQTTITSTSNTPLPGNILLMASNVGANFSTRCLQLVTIGDGLTTSEMSTLRTIENTYKTSLGR